VGSPHPALCRSSSLAWLSHDGAVSGLSMNTCCLLALQGHRLFITDVQKLLYILAVYVGQRVRAVRVRGSCGVGFVLWTPLHSCLLPATPCPRLQGSGCTDPPPLSRVPVPFPNQHPILLSPAAGCHGSDLRLGSSG
jgi:hypothetical protein